MPEGSTLHLGAGLRTVSSGPSSGGGGEMAEPAPAKMRAPGEEYALLVPEDGLSARHTLQRPLAVARARSDVDRAKRTNAWAGHDRSAEVLRRAGRPRGFGQRSSRFDQQSRLRPSAPRAVVDSKSKGIRRAPPAAGASGSRPEGCEIEHAAWRSHLSGCYSNH